MTPNKSQSMIRILNFIILNQGLEYLRIINKKYNIILIIIFKRSEKLMLIYVNLNTSRNISL